MEMGVGIATWEWEGTGIKNPFPNTSSRQDSIGLYSARVIPCALISTPAAMLLYNVPTSFFCENVRTADRSIRGLHTATV